MHWLLNVAAGAASTVIAAAFFMLARDIRRFMRWARDQAGLIDQLDLAGSRMLASAQSLADTTTRLERLAHRAEKLASRAEKALP